MSSLANRAMALVLVLLAADACAQWRPGPDPAAGDTKRPAPDGRFHLPSDAPGEGTRNLQREIDGIDVPETAKLEGPTNRRGPDRGNRHARGRGPAGAAGGSPVSRTKASPSSRMAGEAVTRARAAGRRAATAGTGGEPVPTPDNQESRHESPARFNGRAAERDWEVKGRAPALYYNAGYAHSDINTLPAPGNETENGEYLFTRTDGTTEVNVGHHAIDHDGLVMHKFHRRGMSATRSLTGGISGTAFAMRAAPVTGNEYILGLEDGHSRVMGGAASINPFGDALAVAATVLSGRDHATGKPTAGRPIPERGDAAGVAAESRLIGDTLQLRGEYARTDHDFGGGAAGSRGKLDDDAALARVKYTPIKGAGRGDASTDLSLGAVYRETGPFFRSIANRQATADQNLRRVYSDFRRGSVKMSLTAETTHDNVDNASDRPRLNTDMSKLNVSYSPGQHAGANRQVETPWYGRPSLSSGLQYRRQEQTRLPRDLQTAGVDRRVRNARVSARFSYPAWNWHVGRDFGFRDDFTPQGTDQRRDTSDVGMNFSITNRVGVELQYRYNRVHDEDRPVMRSRTWRASAEAVLIPDTFTGSLDYGMKLADAGSSATHVEHGFVNLELDWQIVKTGKHRPGMSVWLRGHLRHLENQADAPSESRPSRIFVGMRMDWLDSTPRSN